MQTDYCWAQARLFSSKKFTDYKKAVLKRAAFFVPFLFDRYNDHNLIDVLLRLESRNIMGS